MIEQPTIEPESFITTEQPAAEPPTPEELPERPLNPIRLLEDIAAASSAAPEIKPQQTAKPATGKSQLDTTGAPLEVEPYVMLYEAPYETLAQAAKSALQMAGINFIERITNDSAASPYTPRIFSRILVPDSKYKQALKLIQQIAAYYAQPDHAPTERLLKAAANRPTLEAHRGATIATIAIISLFISFCSGGLGIIPSLVAIAMSNADLAKMRQGLMDPAGRSSTTAGRSLGLIGIVLNLIALLFFFSRIL